MAYSRNGYYYRSKRRGRRVTTEYLGAGEIGEMVATLDTLERQERKAEAARVAANRKRFTDQERVFDAIGNTVTKLAAAVLVANGYHTNKGTWRKARTCPSP